MRDNRALLASLLLLGCGGGSTPARPDASADAGKDARASRDAGRGDGASAKDAAPTGFGVPLESTSPWPKFRRDAVQSGESPIKPSLSGGTYFDFPTGRGVFSSPVVAGDGTIYIGSADQSYYALNADGTLRWKIDTGEIIDSAGLLDDQGNIYFGSGDGILRAASAKTGAVVWQFHADPASTNSAYLSWFEGNVGIGTNGDLYAPNDNYFVYALDRATGTQRWRFTMPDQTWSLPAVDLATGDLFVGNNELLSALGDNTFGIGPDGGSLWQTSSPGTVAASPLLTSDGTLIVGGFDGFFHAYSAATGTPLWSTAARDHVYASAALMPDGSIVVPAADGTLYDLDARSGAVKWTFDTPEPIRSSPAVDGDGNVYFGGGDGVLYVVGPTGTLRWSLVLIDQPRRNLNASPALGQEAIYIGGESGEIFGVPYDYCLRSSQQSNARCSKTAPLSGVADGASLIYSEPFGGLDVVAPSAVDANQALAFTLRVRASGQSQLAILDSSSLVVTVNGMPATQVDLAGNGQFLVITPDAGGFVGDASGNITVAIRDSYLVDLTRQGLALEPDSGTVGGTVSGTFKFALSPASAIPLPLPIPVNAGEPSGVFVLSRISLPLPTILPSYNQIGFDSLVYLVGLVEGNGTSGVAWMAGAKYLTGQTAPVIDPATQTLLPLTLQYGGGLLTLANDGGLDIDVLNTLIPLRSFRVSARVDASGNAAAGAGLTGDTVCASVPTYGIFLEKLGFCNPQTDLLTVFGGANLGPFGAGTSSLPAGVGTVTFAATATSVTATLAGGTLVAANHVTSVLLIDATTGLPVPGISYGPLTTRTVAAGVLTSVTVPLPSSPPPPTSLRAYLMVDTYPAAQGTVTIP